MWSGSRYQRRVKMGPDTYTVSAAAAPARGGSSEARKIALTAANEHCAQMGKEILVTNVDTATTNIYGAGSAEVTFRCLAKAVATTSVPAHAGLLKAHADFVLSFQTETLPERGDV